MILGDALGDSKTEKMLLLILVLIVLFGILAVVILVVFDKSIIEIMIAVYGALGLNGAGSLVRNIQVDKPIRQQEALIQTAQRAKQENINIPVTQNLASNSTVTPEGLQVWKPEDNKS